MDTTPDGQRRTKYQCITATEAYDTKSLEELRVDFYLATPCKSNPVSTSTNEKESPNFGRLAFNEDQLTPTPLHIRLLNIESMRPVMNTHVLIWDCTEALFTTLKGQGFQWRREQKNPEFKTENIRFKTQSVEKSLSLIFFVKKGWSKLAGLSQVKGTPIATLGCVQICGRWRRGGCTVSHCPALHNLPVIFAASWRTKICKSNPVPSDSISH